MNEIEEILRQLYVTAVQDADGVSAGKKTYHMRYDEVPKIVAQQISDLLAKREVEARIDENDLWLSHSTARRLNDNDPAIRTVDLKDRVTELKEGTHND